MRFVSAPRLLLLLPLLAAASGLLESCASHHFFQPDARIGPGSTAPLPAAADTVRAVAGRHYKEHWALHYLFWGRHYRRVWAAPVTAPVLKLASAVPGGLRAGKAGGGFQSISMTLEGATERVYSLRALDKEPQKTLPKVLRHTFVLDLVRDATSAALPYAALTVPPLAQAAGVAHGRPRLVYVRQDETGLGDMSERFQGKLALLEEKYETPASRTPDIAQAKDFVDSEGMLKQLYAQPTTSIDQQAFLRARLLDVWLGDWDRHEGQWNWAAFPQPGGRIRYQGIPKDRDQVYFRFDDGLVPWLASRPFAASKFHTFKPKYGYMPGLIKQARFIDQRGLSQLTRADFQRTAAELQRRLPDTLIERAIRRLPPAVFALEGPYLTAALRTRRDALPQAADAYYLCWTREPQVGGTAQAERFVVRRYADSTVVKIFSAALGRASGDSLRFQRTYFPKETHLLTLEGLGGDDVFDVTTTGSGRLMPLRIYGGAGTDRLQLQGSRRGLKLFDAPTELVAAGGPGTKQPKKKRKAYDLTTDN